MPEDPANILVTLLAVVLGIGLAFVLATVVSAASRALWRRNQVVRVASRRARHPLRAVLMVLLVWIALNVTTSAADDWRRPVMHLLTIAGIVAGAWLLGALSIVIEESALARFRTDVPDNRHARRVRTQIIVVRRMTLAVLVVCTVAAVLLTFPSARAAGASLLASAGLISIVAGLAAQTSLANVFAGMQIAFTDAIRVDDVVVLEGEWGRIEEITMTYVVVHLWDDRRLILPSTYFTTTPFQNWTRRAADLLGTVELDLDWNVPVTAMRGELKRLLSLTPLWDQRVGILQVTEATGGLVRVRALASAADAPTLFDLRCYLREGLVDWLQREAPGALPQTRFSVSDRGADEVTAGPFATEHPAGTSAAGRAGVEAGSGESASVLESGSGASRPTWRDTQALTVATGLRIGAGGAEAGEAPAGAPGPRGAAARARTGAIPVVPDPQTQVPAQESALFTGSLAAARRSEAFSGPGAEVMAEREQAGQERAEREQGAGGGESEPEPGDGITLGTVGRSGLADDRDRARAAHGGTDTPAGGEASREDGHQGDDDVTEDGGAEEARDSVKDGATSSVVPEAAESRPEAAGQWSAEVADADATGVLPAVRGERD